MAQARSKVKHRKLEPITYEELLENTSMRGLVSFLDVPPGRAQVIPITLPSETAPGVETTPGAVLTPLVEETPGIEPTPVVETTPVGETAPVVETTPGVVSRERPTAGRQPASRRPRIQPCITARDGHSLGEEALYAALWGAAHGSGSVRTLTIGWRGMSKLSKLTPKNAKINTCRLIEKLALEVVSAESPAESIGRTYRIYGAAELLARRAKAGLTHVIRTRGVQFVDAATGAEKTPGVVSTTGVEKDTVVE